MHYTDEELVDDVRVFQRTCLTSADPEKLVRAARVAKDIRTYDEVARVENPDRDRRLLVQLDDAEKRALKREKDVAFSEHGMHIVILTVSLAAFLQGQVQSSINGATLYNDLFGLGNSPANATADSVVTVQPPTLDDWKLGGANASPFLVAGLFGCPAALPINRMVGRRGAMVVAALLILSSSLGAAFCRTWYSLLGVRVINGLGQFFHRRS